MIEVARDGVVVSSGDHQCVGGARPLVEHRLLLAGHHDSIRPIGISLRLSKEEMTGRHIVGDVNMMMIEGGVQSDAGCQRVGSEGTTSRRRGIDLRVGSNVSPAIVGPTFSLSRC